MPLGGTSVSGYGVVMIPQAPLSWMVLLTTVSKRPPAMTMPVPTGPADAAPVSCGTFGLLLSCTSLCRQISHDPPPLGHEPSCGDGASSLFCELLTIPLWLSSHSPYWMMRCPPELVPL